MLVPVLAEQCIDTISEAENGAELIKCLSEKRPDIVLLEVALCDINLFSLIKKRHPALKIILTGNHTDTLHRDFIYGHLVSAILPKNTDTDAIIDCIRRVHFNMYATEKKQSSYENAFFFSQRETELIPLIMTGKSNKEIAGCMNICDKSVEAYKKSIFRKTKTKNTIAFILFAIRQGLYRLT